MPRYQTLRAPSPAFTCLTCGSHAFVMGFRRTNRVPICASGC